MLGSLGVAYSMLGNVFTNESKAKIVKHCRDQFLQTEKEAEDLVVYSHWIVQQCGTASAGFTRIVKRLYRMNGNASFEPVMATLSSLSAGETLSAQQREALEEVQTVFRLR